MAAKDAHSRVLEGFLVGSRSWENEYHLAWRSLGAPEDLLWENLIADPMGYDSSATQLLESCYSAVIGEAIRDAFDYAMAGAELDPSLVADRLNKVVSWPSVWRQIVPFLAGIEAIGGSPIDFKDFVGAFTFAQAIPANLFDAILDESKSAHLSIELGMSRVLALVCKERLEGSPLGMTLSRTLDKNCKVMLSRMINEAQSRFNIRNLDRGIEEYIRTDPGVTASVFYRIGLQAAALSVESSPQCLPYVGDTLSVCRQLNDEILDLDDDIAIGMTTLPSIICSGMEPVGQCFKVKLNQYWRSGCSDSEALTELVGVVRDSGSMLIAGQKSAERLYGCVVTLLEATDFRSSFPLMANIFIRIALLRRLELNGWRNVSPARIYRPFGEFML